MTNKIPAAVLAALLTFSLAACSQGGAASPEASSASAAQSAAAPAAVSITDDLGRQVEVEAPGRVAAMIGSFAHIWCLAGGKDTLVAAANDAWTSFDLGLPETVVNFGTTTEPSLEAILAAEPDLILASCNTASNLELQSTFEQAGIPTAFFDVQGFDDYLRMLKICTQLTGCPENYVRYGTDVQTRVEAAIARQDGSAPTVLCLRATGSSCKVKGSEGTVLGEMLAALGCVNIADSDSALLEDLSLEAILAADPDYIFVALQGADPARAQATLEVTLLSNPVWSTLRAVREGNFHTMENALYNLKPNDRWGEAYEKLADILYPA